MDNNSKRSKNIIAMAVLSGITIAVILVAGTIWSGRSASRDTGRAVRWSNIAA